MKDQFKDGGVVLDNAIGFWIHRVYQAGRNETFRGFREAGTSVTPEQWAVLIRLWENDGQTQTALSDSTFRDKPTMSRILDVLERDGIITRRDDASDGRVRVVTLTRHGRELKRRLVPVAERIVSKMVAGISDQDLETTRAALKVMFQNLGA
jgi:MarR family transcriptional regulator, organic hydroperoxide resistance regulator